MPEYRSMLIASQCLRWGSLGLAVVYLLARVVGGYLMLFGDYSDVETMTTSSGLSGYLASTLGVLLGLGVVYTLGESVAALRDIARNSFRK